MYEHVRFSAPSMGGMLNVVIAADSERRAAATAASRTAAARVNAWARRLSRFEPASDLSTINASTAAAAPIRPTLALTLAWAREAHRRSDGVVDATLLDERLAAQAGAAWGAAPLPVADRSWALVPAGRSAVLKRRLGVRFDIDGIAKGWLADRALGLLGAWPGAAVDAEGDVALTAGPDVEWRIDVRDPHDASTPLATLAVRGGESWVNSYGVATSGTSVHRWKIGRRSAHHLIDPRSSRSALTDVVQATVLAPSAREAEVLAKVAVILGSEDALPVLERRAALAAILLLEGGEVVALPGVERWLA